MKTGYSLLLSEYIDSEKINYLDCKTFQIVCPICKEPIFKVERKDEASIIHYLSHYEKSKAFISDCELRVKGISNPEKEKNNALSRGQKLSFFLSILKDEILKNEFSLDSKNIKRAKNETLRWMNSPGVQIFLNRFHKFQVSNAEMNKPESLSSIFDDYVKDILMTGDDFPNSGFGIETQKRIATDIWLHLLSAKAVGNFSFLLCVALGIFSERIALASRQRELELFEHDFMRAINQLIKVKKKKAERLLNSMSNTPIDHPFALPGSNYLSKFTSEICFEMLGIVLRLPYFTMLSQNLKSHNNT